MQNVRRRPLSRRKCNYLRVYEIQNKSLLTVTTTPPFCATIPPVRSSSDTNYFMRQSGAHSPCSPLSSSAARKFTTSKAPPSPSPQLHTTKQAHRQPVQITGSRRACFLALYYFRIHLRHLLGAFSSGNSIISPDTPFPPASAQSGTVPPP